MARPTIMRKTCQSAIGSLIKNPDKRFSKIDKILILRITSGKPLKEAVVPIALVK